MSDSSVKSRLSEFLKSQHISKAEFSRRLGLSSTYVNAMRKSLPAERVRQIMDLFPNLNRDWLLYGEGEMLNDYVESSPDNLPTPEPDGFTIPLLPVEAFAGRLQDFSIGVLPGDCVMITSPVKGADFAIRISGDSMEPEIHNGSFAAISRINDKAFIPWGNPMVIDSENGVLIKLLYPSETNPENVTARSYNPAYPSFDIPRSSIFGLYRIVAYWRSVSTM